MADYKALLENLLDERRKLNRAISALEALVQEPETSIGNPTRAKKSERIYAQMTLKAAARKCLQDAKKALSAPELKDELLAGGYRTRAKKFRAQIYSVLLQDPDFVCREGKWSLKEWESSGLLN